jgi:hypothetical protein
VTGSREDAMAKLRERHDADGDLIRQLAEWTLLLPSDEDRGVENRLHPKSSF